MRRSGAIIIVGALVLSACAGSRPPIPGNASVTAPLNWRSPLASDTVPPDARWWNELGDSALSALVAEALVHNEDIEIAAARVEEARGQFAAARGARLPTAQFVSGGARSRSVNAFGSDIEQWAGQAEVQASFDLDLFGKLKNSAAAARAQLLSADYNRETVRLAIATAVASGYVQLCAADARLAVLQETLEARRAGLRIIRRRAEAGYGSALDLAQAEAELEGTAQAIPTTQLAIAKLENGLSIVLGRAPGAIGRGRELSALRVPRVPVQIPAAILRARPDLIAAEQQIVAADRTLDAARAAFLPDISLSASGGFVSSSLIPGDPLSVFSLGGSILAPLLNGGRLRAQADVAAARRDQAALAYRRAALTAFREVEDGMASSLRLNEQEEALSRQQSSLARALDLATRRYREGYSPYLEQLDAERSLLSTKLSLVQSRSERLLAAIALFQAVGGRSNTKDIPPV